MLCRILFSTTVLIIRIRPNKNRYYSRHFRRPNHFRCMPRAFGLAMFTAQQRTAGNRYSQSAWRQRITGNAHAFKRILQLVLIASLIAFPAAWWAMNKWLPGLRLQDRYKLVDACHCWFCSHAYCVAYRKLPGSEGGSR